MRGVEPGELAQYDQLQAAARRIGAHVTIVGANMVGKLHCPHCGRVALHILVWADRPGYAFLRPSCTAHINELGERVTDLLDESVPLTVEVIRQWHIEGGPVVLEVL